MRMGMVLLLLGLGAGTALQARDPPPVVVDRNWVGWCPRGYVAHPSDPDKCVLPEALERYYARRYRDRPAPRPEPAPVVIQAQNPDAVREAVRQELRRERNLRGDD